MPLQLLQQQLRVPEALPNGYGAVSTRACASPHHNHSTTAPQHHRRTGYVVMGSRCTRIWARRAATLRYVTRVHIHANSYTIDS